MDNRKKQELASLALTEAAALLAAGETSSAELTGLLLERIEASDNNAYITVNPQALAAAEAADARRRGGGRLSPIDGVPMGLKDNFCVRGLGTTCGSRMLESFVPPYTAAAAERLEAAGAVLLGKTNMDEFATGSATDTSYFGPTKNPRDPRRVPGGSSGGSAAAVAEDTAYFALGSDTGGSVRQPAAFCGVVGLKPTYGRVSRFGLVAFASSLDQVGPLNKTVADCALTLSLIAGQDPRDSSTLPDPPPDYGAGLKGAEGLKGLRVGAPKEYMGDGIQEEIRQSIRKLIGALEGAGAIVEECSLPQLDYALSAYYVISSAEFSSNMGRYDGVKYGYRAASYEGYEDMLRRSRSQAFGDEVKRRILLGTYALSAGYFDAYYLRAQKARTLIMEDFRRAFGKYDVLLTPTAPVTAWPLGAAFEDPSKVYAMDICTVSVNVAGLPAISLPWGADKAGLPIGVQLIGPTLSEAQLLRAAHGVEELRGQAFGRPQGAKRGERYV
jgi:aspartyl-tRNA(Asn)/glutamyl-tRNA(Gln) amidotransferase subunit A